MHRRLRWLSLAALAACADDVAQPYELDHARVLAIRTDPAQLGPGDRGALEVLATDAAATPRLATPAELEVTLAPELDRPELRALLTASPQGWAVQAPDAASLAQARVALALPADAPLPLPLRVRVHLPDRVLEAHKVVLIGAHLPNPPPPQILLSEPTARSGDDTERSLTISAMPPGASARWFAWPGELAAYTQPEATWTLSPQERSAGGLVAVVVRSLDGGVAWRIQAVAPAP